jgi:Alginate export
MKKLVFTGTLLAAMLSSGITFGQEVKNGELIISGQVRPRFEFRDGFKKPMQQGEEAAAFVEQRARINLLYKASDFNVKLSLQDVRIWGDVGQINKSDGLSSFHEAYGEWVPKSNMALKIGRQELVYNDARILGNLDWAAQGRSFDAVKFVYTDSLWEAHLVTTYNQDATTQEPAKLQSPTAGNFNPNGSSAIGFKLPYAYMTQVAYFKKKFAKGDFSALIVNDVIQKTNTTGSVDRLTVGIDPNMTIGKVKLNASAYLQTGKESDAMKSTAFLGSFTATLNTGKKITPTLGIDYLSGDDTTSKKVNEAFNPLYGTHHAFYGYMDYFYVGNAHANKGLVDIYLKTDIKFKKSKLMAHLHSFSSAAENYSKVKFAKDGSKVSAKYLGTEVDLVYVKALSKNIKFTGGTSFMFASDGLHSIKGTAMNVASSSYKSTVLSNWTWAMIDFTF